MRILSMTSLGAALVALLLAAALAGCERAFSVPRVGTFVGTVEGTDAFVALAHVDGEVMAYVCDGATTATWLRGRIAGRDLDLAAGESRVQARFDDGRFVGTFASGSGAVRRFSARPSGGGAGFYRAAQTLAGAGYVGGWILLSDGRQRGAVKRDGAVLPGAAPLDPAEPVVRVPGGALQAQPAEHALAALAADG